MCELRASAVPWQRLCSLPCVSLNPSPLLPEGEDTGGDIITPLLADFSFDLVSAKLPRHKLFCINILLNDWIMNLCVCTFWRWDHSWAVLWETGLCLPHLTGLVQSWAVLKMLSRGDIRESGTQKSLVNISSTEGCKWVWKCWSNLLPCYRIFAAPARPCVRDMRLPAQISLWIWLCGLKV